MTNIFKSFHITLSQKEKKQACQLVVILAVLLYAISFFDKALSIGLFFLLLLFFATIFLLYGFGVRDKNIYIVFLMGLLVHLGVALLLYWTGLKPFGGGADFTLYDQIARDIADRFSHGNFSLAGLYTDHFFPILIGILYMVTLPSMIVGQLFIVWLSAFSILLVYLIVIEIGGTKKTAFLASLVVSIYPSYLYFGSVLLKDTVVIPLALVGILFILKIVNPIRNTARVFAPEGPVGSGREKFTQSEKFRPWAVSNGVNSFSWIKFLAFFVILSCLINLRFYIGYSLMFSFVICWFIISSFKAKEKVIYGVTMIFLLGFSPQIVGNGYYGFNSFKNLINPEKITYYREIVYSNNSSLNSQPTTPQSAASQPTASQPTINQPTTPQSAASQPTASQPTINQPNLPQKNPPKQELNGSGSNFELETGFKGGAGSFLKNSFQSFTYSLLGPFPWQLTQKRQVIGLAETIPWYILIIAFTYGSVSFIKKNGILPFLKFYKSSLPLLIFSIFTLGALSLFINNYGIIARIRIPAFICLISIICVMFNERLEQIYEPR